MSSIQRTLSIVKPDAVKAGNHWKILDAIEQSGLKIVAMKKMRLTKAQAEGFYYVHAERPFFGELVEFMTSGPVIVSVLEGEDAIARYRNLMGPTNSEVARTEAPESIRAKFGTDIQNNASHGSDAVDTARFEIAYYFGYDGLVG